MKSTKRVGIWVCVAALAVIAARLYFHGDSQTPAGQPPLVRLTEQNLPLIESTFNSAKSDVRLLLLLSPT